MLYCIESAMCHLSEILLYQACTGKIQYYAV